MNARKVLIDVEREHLTAKIRAAQRTVTHTDWSNVGHRALESRAHEAAGVVSSARRRLRELRRLEKKRAETDARRGVGVPVIKAAAE